MNELPLENLTAKLHARACLTRLTVIINRAGEEAKSRGVNVDVMALLESIAVSAANLSGVIAAAQSEIEKGKSPELINEAIFQAEMFCMIAEDAFTPALRRSEEALKNS